MNDKYVYKPCLREYDGKVYDLGMVMSRVQFCDAIMGRPNGVMTKEEVDRRFRFIVIESNKNKLKFPIEKKIDNYNKLRRRK